MVVPMRAGKIPANAGRCARAAAIAHFGLPQGPGHFVPAHAGSPHQHAPVYKAWGVHPAAGAAISCAVERTHLRFILSQTSSDWPDIAIVRGSGQRVTPRSARKRSMTLSSVARHCESVTGSATARRRPTCLVAISLRPSGCELHAAAGRTMIVEERVAGASGF